MKLPRLLSLLLLLLPLIVSAAEPRDVMTAEQVKRKLLAAQPGLPIRDVVPGALEGYFEVHLRDGMVLYMSSTADYFFAGDLFFVQPEGLLNATENARVAMRKALLDSLDASKMVIFAPPEEQTLATITVFTDIDCSFCRKFHREVPELNRMGIAVRYLAYPRSGIGTESYDKAVSAWCAEDRQAALTNAKSGKEIKKLTCANPVAAQYALGGDFGVTGTPTIVYENGELLGGYLPASELAQRLGVVN